MSTFYDQILYSKHHSPPKENREIWRNAYCSNWFGEKYKVNLRNHVALKRNESTQRLVSCISYPLL